MTTPNPLPDVALDGWFITEQDVAVQWRHVLLLRATDCYKLAWLPETVGFAVVAELVGGRTIALRKFDTQQAAVEWILHRPWQLEDPL